MGSYNSVLVMGCYNSVLVMGSYNSVLVMGYNSISYGKFVSYGKL